MNVLHCVHNSREFRKKALHHLEVGLEIVVSCHVCSGNWTWSSSRAASALNYWTISKLLTILSLKLFTVLCFVNFKGNIDRYVSKVPLHFTKLWKNDRSWQCLDYSECNSVNDDLEQLLWKLTTLSLSGYIREKEDVVSQLTLSGLICFVGSF